MRAHLTKPTVSLLVAEAEMQGFAHVVGYALIGFRASSNKGRLYSLARDPQHRLGLGRPMLGACEEEARQRGAEILTLEVRADNARAIELYEQRGL